MITGQVYRATKLAVSGNWDQAGSVLVRPEDMLLDGVLGGLGSALGYGVRRLFQHILTPKLTPHDIGDAAEQIAADNLPIDLDKIYVKGIDRNRYYDGVLRIDSKNFVEIKTSTKGTVFRTKFIRDQALFDYNYKIRSGKPPLWIFVNSKPSGPLVNLLIEYGLPYISFWE